MRILELVIWLFPIIFMFHDLEEMITIESFMNSNNTPKTSLARLTLSIKKKLGATAAQFAVAVAWMLLIISFTTVMTASPTGKSFLLFVAILNVFFLQTFSHIAQSIIFKGYTPGIITALVLVIPYCLITYHSLLERGLIDWHLIFGSLPISLIMIPIFLVGNLLSRYFIR